MLGSERSLLPVGVRPDAAARQGDLIASLAAMLLARARAAVEQHKAGQRRRASERAAAALEKEGI